MTATHINEFKPHSSKSRSRPLSATLLAAALAVVAAACVVLLAPVVWTAGKAAFEMREPTLAQCEMISADAARLACFDLLGRQAIQPPAKGALAPAAPR
jgi:hypothetical protein